ncbi:DNA-binding response regulator [Vagococcus penaei]|uniref:DNA-binding response regulator n=1 Tax=Vagococcus penaei TaxID=633807 RepID=A0A1Q2D4T6_9ENTE|nr:response regulator transcription factor [Vagococcus penaei]AQP53393.1 DNA-binding response regulator [Vagococcus penaei]RST99715.1 DNA-binding response regulator [Vagococcus penaei]
MSKHILIIEDDPSIANLQRDYLEINGYTVTIEHNGHEGLHLALTIDFSLVIVDIMLPTMDGFDICKAIRRVKQTPIIIVSAKREDIDKIRGLGLGADDYVIKPFSPSELVARVNAHISRYKTLLNEHSEKDVSQIGLITIDHLAHKVTTKGSDINLTNKEFSLLSFLATHPNRVWHKEALFEAVWGFDVLDTDVSTVVVHIKRIREKLKKAGIIDFPIETVWGSGYRLTN